MNTVLAVDDEAHIRAIVRAAVEADGGRVVEAATAAAARTLAVLERPQCIVLDLGLPDGDGIEVCREIRGWSSAPILVLSARFTDEEKVRLLDAGADDYLTKPFSIVELRARIRAHLRRAAMAPVLAGDAPLKVGELTIDRAARAVFRLDARVHLTPTEWALLQALLDAPGRTLTHHALFDAVWGRQHGDAQQYLRVYVANLRRKLECDPLRPTLVHTEPGVGYRLELPESAEP